MNVLEHLMHLKIKLQNDGEMLLHIKVITNAQRTEFTEVLADEQQTLKLKVNAIPEDNKANKEILKFLKKEFNAECEIMSGQLNNRKVIKITKV